jgi:hypothetical protein
MGLMTNEVGGGWAYVTETIVKTTDPCVRATSKLRVATTYVRLALVRGGDFLAAPLPFRPIHGGCWSNCRLDRDACMDGSTKQQQQQLASAGIDDGES